jgi:hypothetical protein
VPSWLTTMTTTTTEKSAVSLSTTRVKDNQDVTRRRPVGFVTRTTTTPEPPPVSILFP